MSFLLKNKKNTNNAGSKPVSHSKSGSSLTSSNGRVVNPFQNPKPQPPGPVTVPHSNSDLNSRKMVVLQEYRPTDAQGLGVRRGEVVQVIKEEPNWFYVRNERNKEGYVPSNHLVAPYSSMRSKNRVLGVPNPPPMRHVASGSSVDIKDPAPVVPMYPSVSAGRPRKHSMGDENRINAGVMQQQRRSYSPHEMNSNSLPPGQTGLSPYDQKYSPSTSSGVASFTGTTSPVGHSDGSHHSSLGSVEDELREGTEEGVKPIHNGHAYTDNDEQIKPGRPHPSYGNEPSQQHQDHQRNAYSSHAPNEAPPPLPPRTFYNTQAPQPPPLHPASQGDLYLDAVEDADSYASPADAIPRQQSPFLGHPRGRSLNDVRLREIRRSQENGVYTEVFQGHQRPPRPNGYRLTDDDNQSEGGSSRSRSSRKSGSRVSSLQTQTTAEPYPYYDCEVFSHESSEITPNESTGRGSRPLSANSINKSGQTKIKKFRKNLWGVYIVMQDFEARDENEVNVRRGDHVSLWNQDDRDWYWIVKHDTSSEEGFVPSSHLKELNPDSQSHMQDSKQGYVMEDQIAKAGYTVEDEEEQFDVPPPPLPPKPPAHPPHPPHGHVNRRPPQQPRSQATAGYDNHTSFRQRATSHDCRPSSKMTRGGGVSMGSTGSFRGRLSSDGSGSAQSSGALRGPPSTPGVDRREQRSISPPNTPPPPYTEFDNSYQRKPPTSLPPMNGNRHYSLSQQDQGSSAPYMQRTRSHGQVPYRRANIHRVATTPSGDMGRLRSNKSPTEMPGGGTLV